MPRPTAAHYDARDEGFALTAMADDALPPRQRHPRFVEAVLADARIATANRGERYDFRSRADAMVQAARLACVTDAFLALVLYRLKAHWQATGVPVLPWFAHRLAIMIGQVSIGDPVVVQPGVYLPHGQVVVDGFVDIARGTTIAPFVTIGLRAGDLEGPTIGPLVSIGTGAKIIGPVHIGAKASIGANAVVVADVAPGVTVAGIPARVIRRPD